MFRFLVLLLCAASLLAAAQTTPPPAPPEQPSPSQTPKAERPPAPATPPAPAEPGKPVQPAQSPVSPSPATPKSRAVPAKPIPPSAPVITIKGLCSPPPKAAAAGAKPPECKTVVTRAQLEQVIAVVRPNLPPAQLRGLATEYVQFLVMANAARKAGVEKSPQVQKRLELSRMQVLAMAYTQQLAQQNATPSDAEVDSYYRQQRETYEQLALHRVYLPKPAPVEDKPADEAGVKAIAQQLRERAMKGEAFEKLQEEAYKLTQQQGTPPPSNLGDKRRGTLPPNHEDEVFQLKPGDVSPAYEEASGFFIYKVEKKSLVPLAEVKEEIQRTLQQEKMRAAVDRIRSSVQPVFNEDYFGSAEAAAPPVSATPGGAGGAPAHGQKPAAPAPSAPAPATPGEAPKTPPAQPAAPGTAAPK